MDKATLAEVRRQVNLARRRHDRQSEKFHGANGFHNSIQCSGAKDLEREILKRLRKMEGDDGES